MGTSLNKFVYILIKAGHNKEQIFMNILKIATDERNKEHIKNWSNAKLIDSIKIGVSARMAEYSIMQR